MRRAASSAAARRNTTTCERSRGGTLRSARSSKRPESVQVLAPFEHLLARRFQDERAVGQRVEMEQGLEAFEPHVALADVDVPVGLPAQGDGRVVAMTGADPLRRNDGGEL